SDEGEIALLQRRVYGAPIAAPQGPAPAQSVRLGRVGGEQPILGPLLRPSPASGCSPVFNTPYPGVLGGFAGPRKRRSKSRKNTSPTRTPATAMTEAKKRYMSGCDVFAQDPNSCFITFLTGSWTKYNE